MDYKIKYSNRKTVSIEITKNAEILIRAPYNTPDSFILKTLKEHENWIVEHLTRMQRRKDATPDLSAEQIKEVKRIAKEQLSEIASYYASLMGLKYGRISITSAKTRFGSCNYDGNICFSYRLMFYPLPVQEYVVVHELSHLVHMNHSKEFYKLVESVLPDYKKREKYLKLPIGTEYK